jgi:hypothetical protein
VWHIAKPYLAKAAARTKKLDVDQVADLCRAGDMTLWLIYFPEEFGPDGREGDFYGAVVTDIQDYKNGWRAARVLGLGGKQMKRWIHLIKEIEQWASQWGCDAIEIVGRKGWGRMYPDYEPIEYVYAKELKHG